MARPTRLDPAGVKLATGRSNPSSELERLHKRLHGGPVDFLDGRQFEGRAVRCGLGADRAAVSAVSAVAARSSVSGIAASSTVGSTSAGSACSIPAVAGTPLTAGTVAARAAAAVGRFTAHIFGGAPASSRASCTAGCRSAVTSVPAASDGSTARSSTAATTTGSGVPPASAVPGAARVAAVA